MPSIKRRYYDMFVEPRTIGFHRWAPTYPVYCPLKHPILECLFSHAANQVPIISLNVIVQIRKFSCFDGPAGPRRGMRSPNAIYRSVSSLITAGIVSRSHAGTYASNKRMPNKPSQGSRTLRHCLNDFAELLNETLKTNNHCSN